MSYAELHALLARIFAAHGMPEASAAILASAVAQAERDGCLSHGLFRMPGLSLLAARGISRRRRRARGGAAAPRHDRRRWSPAASRRWPSKPGARALVA
jgi:hypothetical protein